MLPSNRPWDTLCPQAHCRRRKNCNLLIQSMLLATTPYHNYSILSTTTGVDILAISYVPTNARDSSISKDHRNRLGFVCGSFCTTAHSCESTWRPHVSAEKRPSDYRDVDSSTWEMASGRRQKDREDLFLCDRDADECNQADLEALFRVSW